MVFEGDLSAWKGNPFHVETPFGRPVAIGFGDAFAELDAALDHARRPRMTPTTNPKSDGALE